MRYVPILIGTVWLVAAITKAASMDQLVGMVKALLPGTSEGARWIALAVVVSEFLTGTCLLVPRFCTVGLQLTLCGAATFLGVNYLRFAYGIHAPCSCFGRLYKAEPLAMAGIDLVLIAISAMALARRTKEVYS